MKRSGVSLLMFWLVASIGLAQEIDREAARAAAAGELERAQEVERLLAFDGEGRIKPRRSIARAARFELDNALAYLTDGQSIAPGLSVKLARAGRWALSGAAVAGAAGASVTVQIVPVVDVRAGLAAFWRPADGGWSPALVVSVARW